MGPEADPVRPAMQVDMSGDGIAAGHPRREEHPVPVATSTEDQFNTLQPPLVTVGCALVPDGHFEFDSSFILPGAARSFRKLVRLVKRMPGCPLSVFGHADPVGRDSYNKTLSGRRAMAVYGVLIRDTALWDDKLYRQPFGGDRWGTRSLQIILTTLDYYHEEADGRMDRPTRDAVEAFQQDHSDELSVDRDPGPNTRKKLFEVYMDYLCADDQGQPFRVEKADFLGAGSDRDGKADYQGCGEFNPVLVFSDTEQQEFEKPENAAMRNEANTPNRRVIVFLFRKGTRVNPNLWPCPRAKEDGAGCKQRFWSDGEDRRSRRLPDERRKFQETEDTFACRFYHGLAAYSPCEAALKLWVVRLKIDGPDGQIPLAGKRFALTAGESDNAPILRGTTDEEGVLRVPVYDDVVTMTLKLDASGSLTPNQDSNNTSNSDQGNDSNGASQQPGTGTEDTPREDEPWEGEDKFMQFTLQGGALLPMDPPQAAPVRQRLHNLGYGPRDPDNWEGPTMMNAIKAFQHDQGVSETGDGDEQTRNLLRQAHGG